MTYIEGGLTSPFYFTFKTMETEEIEIKEEEKIVHTVLTRPEFNEKFIKEIAEEIHPGCWDLGPTVEPALIDKFGRASHRLIITIPEATVKNRRGRKHNITGFHMVIPLTKDYSKLNGTTLYSLRSSVSTLEYACGVFHPHSKTVGNNSSLVDYFSWRNMCLGGQTALTEIVYTLYSDGITKRFIFELLAMLHVYARWESEEGGPYRSMQDFAYPAHNYERVSPPLSNLYEKLLLAMQKDDAPLLEIVGNTHYNASTNLASVFAPLVKQAVLDLIDTYEEFDGTSARKLYNSLLGTNSNGRFIPVGVTNTDVTLSGYYKNVMTEMPLFNQQYAQKLLLFNGEPVEFTMTYDPTGLEETSEVALATPEELLEVNLDVVRQLYQKYVHEIFKFQKNHLFY